jgi:ATP-binding cassette subfamily B protein
VADEQSDQPSRRGRLLGYGSHVRMLWAVAPAWTCACLAATVTSAACGILTMVAVGQIVGGLAHVLVHHESPEQLWTWFGIFAGATILTQIAAAVLSWGGAHINAAYRVRVDELVAEVGLQPQDLGRLEDEEFALGLATLADNSRHWLFRFGLTGTWELVAAKLTALGSAAIVLSWRWWVPLVVVACFLGVSRVTARWIDQLLDGIFGRPSPERARSSYLSGLMIGPEAAKEIRLFGLSDWLVRRYSLVWHSFETPFWRDSRRKLVPVVGALAVETAVVGGTLALLAYDTYHGRVSTAAVTTYVLAILGLEAFGPQGDVQSGLVRVAVFLRRLLTTRDSLGLPPLDLASNSAPADRARGAAIVEIRDVTFTYPERDVPTIRGLALTVPAGQSLAVVGVNGAGKTTLMKLLAGLYRPDSGSVRVDGNDPFTEESARRRVSVVFQDFVRYPLSLRDNVGFGATDRMHDQLVLDKAMHDAAGTSILERIGGSWDTVLSKEFEGGTDLSGGQWQRVALARALASVDAGAGVLVLDEPTAALDVRAEAEIFERFLAMTEGVTTILVSHRLSTVRRADRIVVLDGATGGITEDGSHEQLMARRGAYARMFSLQATRFAMAPGEQP